MVILPRLLYPLWALPIKIPQRFFKKLHTILLTILWSNKKPRIKFALLTRPKELGGMGLPDFRKYYIASHLTRTVDWNCHQGTKDWVALEDGLSPYPPTFFLHGTWDSKKTKH